MYAPRVPLAPAADLPALEATGLQRRREAARTLGRDWPDRYLPMVLDHFAWMRAARIADAASALALWDGFGRRVNDIWLIHMLSVPPVYSLLEELGAAYASLTGRPATDAPSLFAGRAATLQEMQQGLHDLAAAVRATPAVAERIPTVRSLDELTALEGGMRIRAAIEAFLERHGDVGQAGFDITSPSWSDEPRQLLVEPAPLLPPPGHSPGDRRLRPPRYLGAPLAAPVPSSAIRDLGYRVEQTEHDLLRGVAASPGTGRGPVRLVSGSADFERFQRGDVLVCRSTTVSWVPLFTMASAIVADIGGALSPAALAAREVCVPPVRGTRAAVGLRVDRASVGV